MKLPRTYKILKMMAWAISTFTRGDKLQLVQTSARFEELGGIYIKFLQLVVLNLDPADQKDYTDLLAVYEHSPADDLDIWQYLREHLSSSQLARFKSLTPQPFATGSFGQVYYGQLDNGKGVIVKVLRPSVQKYIHYDLRLLATLSWLYNLFASQNILNFRTIYKQFKRTCLEEVNYVNELAVADYYFQHFKDHPHLVIPQTHRDLSTPCVLVQDYVSGLSLARLLELQSNGINSSEYVSEQLQSNLYFQLEVVGTELLGQALKGEIMHADPHPGNIILLAGNKVALIDFGMSTVLSSNRYVFYQWLVQYVAYYSGNLSIEEFALCAFRFLQRDLFEAITLADKHFATDHKQTSLILGKMRSTVRDIFQEEANQPAISQLLASRSIMRLLFFTINRGNRYGFSFNLEAIHLIKAAQSFVILIHQFDKESGTNLRVLSNAVRIAENNFAQLADDKDHYPQSDPLSAAETISHWLDKMARNDPWLMQHIASEYIK